MFYLFQIVNNFCTIASTLLSKSKVALSSNALKIYLFAVNLSYILKKFNRFARITNRYTVIRDRTTYNTSCSDYTIFPIVTPGKIITPPPIQAPSLISTGSAPVLKYIVSVSFLSKIYLFSGNIGWWEVYICKFGASRTQEPIIIFHYL